MDRGAWRATVQGVCKVGHGGRLTHTHCLRQSVLSARHLLPGEGPPPRGELAFWPGSGSLRLSLARPLGPRPPRSTLTTTRWTPPWATLSSHSSTTSSGTRNIFGCCSGEGWAGGLRQLGGPQTRGLRARLSLPAPLMEAQRGPAIFLKLHSKPAPEPGRAPPPRWTSRRSAPPGLTGWGGAPVSLSPFLTPQCGFSSPRTKCRTYHDVIPISCLTEFPNVVQMAKVRPLLHQAEPCWQPPWAQSWAAAWPLQTLSFSPKSWPGCCGLSLESCPFCVPLMPARWLCVWGTLWGTFWRQGPPVLPTLF